MTPFLLFTHGLQKQDEKAEAETSAKVTKSPAVVTEPMKQVGDTEVDDTEKSERGDSSPGDLKADMKTQQPKTKARKRSSSDTAEPQAKKKVKKVQLKSDEVELLVFLSRQQLINQLFPAEKRRI